MGSFLKYLDGMEKDFNAIEEKEKYIDEIDDGDIVCEDEDVNDGIKEVVEEKTHQSKSNNIYKKRLVTELHELGLNKKKINEIVYNIFSDDVYSDAVDDYVSETITQYQQPRKTQSSFKQKMTTT